MDALVELDDVIVRRGRFHLDVARWVVPAGSVVGVIGENGAGKTTLLHLLPGWLAPDRGVVRVLGFEPTRDEVAVRTRLGFAADDFGLPAVPLAWLLRQLSAYWPTWDADLVERLLERFALDPARSVGALSKGEGTRLRVLLALAFRPRVLVLDEPATGLDHVHRERLYRTILEVAAEPGRAVIVSSHDLAELHGLCDRVLALDGGRVVADGPMAEVAGEGALLDALVARRVRPEGR